MPQLNDFYPIFPLCPAWKLIRKAGVPGTAIALTSAVDGAVVGCLATPKKESQMMNENIVKGKWTELKGEIRKLWGQLTDDELDETRGDLTKVAGIVQRKYGETQEAIRSKLNSFTSGLDIDKTERKDVPPQERM